MSIFNRLTRQNEPAGWEAAHQDPTKSEDWSGWKIGVEPLTDILIMYLKGELGTGSAAVDKIQSNFDLSTAERAQVVELYNSTINPGGSTPVSDQLLNVLAFKGILGAMERRAVQQFVTVDENWFNTKFGITTPDDR